LWIGYSHAVAFLLDWLDLLFCLKAVKNGFCGLKEAFFGFVFSGHYSDILGLIRTLEALE